MDLTSCKFNISMVLYSRTFCFANVIARICPASANKFGKIFVFAGISCKIPVAGAVAQILFHFVTSVYFTIWILACQLFFPYFYTFSAPLPLQFGPGLCSQCIFRITDLHQCQTMGPRRGAGFAPVTGGQYLVDLLRLHDALSDL